MPQAARICFAALMLSAAAVASSESTESTYRCSESSGPREHGGGLNRCGCHFNHKTGSCHCHQARGCGCECEPASCKGR